MILLFPILVPLVVGLLLAFYPKRELKNWKNPVFFISLLTMLVVFISSIVIFIQGKTSYSIQVTPSTNWSGPAINFDLLAYHFSSFVLLAVLFFGLLITIYSYTQTKKSYFIYVVLTIAASSLAVLSNNLVILLLAWGGVALLLYFLINLGKTGSEVAANKALVMVGGSDILMLVGAAIIYMISGTLTMSEISIPLQGALPIIAFILLLIGTLTKAGAMPFHSWIPDSAKYAPVPVLALFPASLDKLLGIYLLTRISLNLFKIIPNSVISIVLMAVGSVSIIAAVSMALVQKDLLKLLGFHAVSQVGYMVLGIGTGIPLAIIGGLFHMVNNAIYKTGLFLGAGAIEHRTGQTSLEKLGGLARYMPITFLTVFISALAISGIPPLNGFASKWLIYQGVIEASKTQSFLIFFLLAAMFGSVLTLASFLKVLHSTFLGEKSKEVVAVKEAGFGMVFPMVVLAFLSIAFGVFAQVAIRYIFSPILGGELAGVQNLNLLGIWNPTLATGLIILSIVIGFLVYRMRKGRKVRISDVFIGGEVISAESQALVTLPDGGQTRTEVVDINEAKFPGTYFYDSIKKIEVIDRTYESADKKSFDLYEQAKSFVNIFVRAFKKLHNGLLTTYLGYLFLGVLVIMLVVLISIVFK